MKKIVFILMLNAVLCYAETLITANKVVFDVFQSSRNAVEQGKIDYFGVHGLQIYNTSIFNLEICDENVPENFMPQKYKLTSANTTYVLYEIIITTF